MGLKSYIIRPGKGGYTAILLVISVIAGGWFVYQAQASPVGTTGPQLKENYSAIGTVSVISTSTESVSLSGVTTSNGGSGDNFPFDLSSVANIESGDYTLLSIGDIKVGDQVVVQGLKMGDVVTITRVIDLSWTDVAGLPPVASTTDSLSASTTPSTADASSTVSPASSTEAVATSTPAISTTTDGLASSTPDAAATTTQDVASSTTGVASSTAVTASSTPDSTVAAPSASSTDETASSTSPQASTPQVNDASSTDPSPPPADLTPDASTTNP